MMWIFLGIFVLAGILTYFTQSKHANLGIGTLPTESDEDDEVRTPKDGGWEFLEDEEDFDTWRRRVPGGWLVRTQDHYSNSTEAITFFPDQNHNWEV